jgi:hypothetical protein
LLSIRNLNLNKESFIRSNPCLSEKPVSDAKLVFHRYGQQYFLAEVWDLNSTCGRQIQVNSRQTELARNQSKGEVVLIASEK